MRAIPPAAHVNSTLLDTFPGKIVISQCRAGRVAVRGETFVFRDIGCDSCTVLFFGQQVISGAPDPEAMMTEPIEAQRSYACLLALIG